MEKLITGTITISYRVNCRVKDSFNDNEVEEYIKDNMDECIEWEKWEIEDMYLLEDTINEEPTEPEDNTYSGGVIE